MQTKVNKFVLFSRTVNKFLSLFIAIVLLSSVSMWLPSTVYAEENQKQSKEAMQNTVYVALGDSVPAGYGLSNANDCYVNLFSDKLKESGCSNKLFNYAVSGATTQALLAGLQNMQLEKPEALQNIKNAGIITVNIGGNNVLGPLVAAVNKQMEQQIKTLGIKSIAEADSMQLMTIGTTLYSMKLEPEQLAQIQKGAQSFAEDFPKIIDWLNTNAPGATIIVSTIYNPIPTYLSFYDTSETLLKQMNSIIMEGGKKSGYYTADIYTVFEKEMNGKTQILNLNLGQFTSTPMSVDIHPTAAGHKLIAQIHNEAYQNIPVIIKTPPDKPVTTQIKLSGKVNKNETLLADINEANLRTAIEKAKYEATQSGRENDGIAVILKNTDTAAKSINVTMDAASINLLKSEHVKDITIQTDIFRFSFDKEAINKLKEKTKGKVTVKVSPVTRLSKAAKKLIGSRPAFQVTLADTKGNTVSDFGKGKLTLGIHYSAASKEKAGNLHIVFINRKGQPKLINSSSYTDGWLSCSVNVLSTFAVGYKK